MTVLDDNQLNLVSGAGWGFFTDSATAGSAMGAMGGAMYSGAAGAAFGAVSGMALGGAFAFGYLGATALGANAFGQSLGNTLYDASQYVFR